MSQDIQALWKKCLLLIRKNVSEQQYKTWFEPLEVESYEASTKTLLLQVPSGMIYEYIEEHYVDLLTKVLLRIFGKDVSLTYRVLFDKQNNLTQNFPSVPTASITKNVENKSLNKSPNILDGVSELDSMLNSRQTFENFIEGKSNKLSRSLGLSIAQDPQSPHFNPMFVFGPSGCGKTHLINAIGVKIKELFPQKRVLYVSARLFQLQYADATRQNTVPDFIRFYQTIDVLIVDDIQEWMTAHGTQDTFFHIFNHLYRLGKRIILASDRPQIDLKGFNDRLITRFKSGLTAELERPDTELCINILHSIAKRDGLDIPEDVIQFIAETACGSVRDLEGVTTSLLAHSITYNTKIDKRLTERVISRAVKVDNNPLTIDEIVERVCSHYNVSSIDINSKSRKKNHVTARQVSMYLAQKYTKMPSSRIGKLIGGRDHSTVLHSCSQVQERLKTDKKFSYDVAHIENSFKLKA